MTGFWVTCLVMFVVLMAVCVAATRVFNRNLDAVGAYILGGIAGTIAITLLAALGCVLTDRASCENVAVEAGVEWKYPSPMAGCLYNIDGQWIPADRWRVDE